MPLSLRSVPAGQGALWMREGFRLFFSHPLAFSLMFVVFMSAAVVSSAIPLLGGIVVLCAVPLLGLGFMIATRSALDQGPIHPGQYLAPFRGDAVRTRSQLTLCIAYGACTVGVMWIAHWVDGGAFGELQTLLAEQAPQAEIDQLLNDPRLLNGLIVRFGLATLVSIPFWHAPALVHWGQQRPAQALFSSTLAIWRNRGAFVIYLLSWLGMIVLFGVLAALMFGLLGMRQLAGLVAVPAGLIFSTVFYVSLLSTFNDSFGGNGTSSSAP